MSDAQLEMVSEDEHAQLVRLQEQRREAKRIESLLQEADKAINCTVADIASLKTILKGQERTREKLVMEFRAVIRGDSAPLFDTANQAAPVAKDGDEAWRDVPMAEVIDKYGGPTGITTRLQEAALATMGALVDYMDDFELTDIAGIGHGKAEVLAGILEKFWADNPQ